MKTDWKTTGWRGACAALALLATSTIAPAWADDAAPDWSTATVRKLDPANGRVTLRHGPIANLDMPSMTMVFRATPEQMEGIKNGDQVRFRAERVDGVIRVITLEPDRSGN
jgi:Cu/Ag efflux protein CusF